MVSTKIKSAMAKDSKNIFRKDSFESFDYLRGGREDSIHVSLTPCCKWKSSTKSCSKFRKNFTFSKKKILIFEHDLNTFSLATWGQIYMNRIFSTSSRAWIKNWIKIIHWNLMLIIQIFKKNFFKKIFFESSHGSFERI